MFIEKNNAFTSSAGLFNRVIAASGSAINNWSVNSPEKALQISINLARLLGATEADIEDPAKRVQFFKTADPETMCNRATEASGEQVRIIFPSISREAVSSKDASSQQDFSLEAVEQTKNYNSFIVCMHHESFYL